MDALLNAILMGLGWVWFIFKWAAIGIGLFITGSMAFYYLRNTIPKIRHRKTDVPIYAWRFWSVSTVDSLYGIEIDQDLAVEGDRPADPNQLVLRGVLGAYWGKTTHEAKCNRFTTHDAPKVDCTCGIHAIKVGPVLYRELGYSVGAPFQVWGRVALSGNIVEHTGGYRASHAEVVEFAILRHDDKALKHHIYPEVEALVNSFGVPVSSYNFDEFIREVEIGEKING